MSRLKERYEEKKVQSRLTKLRLTMRCDPSRPRKAFPCLEAKAGETPRAMPLALGGRSAGQGRGDPPEEVALLPNLHRSIEI